MYVEIVDKWGKTTIRPSMTGKVRLLLRSTGTTIGKSGAPGRKGLLTENFFVRGKCVTQLQMTQQTEGRGRSSAYRELIPDQKMRRSGYGGGKRIDNRDLLLKKRRELLLVVVRTSMTPLTSGSRKNNNAAVGGPPFLKRRAHKQLNNNNLEKEKKKK